MSIILPVGDMYNTNTCPGLPHPPGLSNLALTKFFLILSGILGLFGLLPPITLDSVNTSSVLTYLS